MTYPATGPTTEASLRSAHWTALPTAPIAVRDGAVGTWTGQQMIVWGGSDGNRTYGDGAAYDPATRVWTKLPAAPIAARAGADHVWTGRLLFIWGSYADRTDSVADGAVYDPVSQRWTALPPPPHSGLGPSAAVWSGSAVVLLTSPRGQPSGGGPAVVYAQAYDPTSNAWTALPTLTLPPGHGLGELSAVAVGGHVFTWEMWSHTVGTPDSSSTTSGVDAFQLDTGRTKWSSITLVPTESRGVLGPLWTGREILVPALSNWCGGCAGRPGGFNASGLRMEPRSSTLTSLSHGPVSDLNATYVWTGAAVLGVGTDAQPGSTTAEWNPGTNAWTTLRPAPLAVQDPVAVWTGTSMIIWGRLYGRSGSVSSRTTGLLLSQ